MKKVMFMAIFAALIAAVFAPGPAGAQEALYNDMVAYVNAIDRQGQSWDLFLLDPWQRLNFIQNFENLYGSYLTHQQIDEFTNILATGNEQAAFLYLRGIIVTEVVPPMSSPDSASNRSADTVIHEVALPSATTRMQAKALEDARKEAEQGGKRFTRMIGGQLRYDWVSTGPNRDGNIPGVTVGMAQDQERFTYGFFIPYDHLNMYEFSADRMGAVLFGQYRIPAEVEGDLSATVYGHYLNLNPNVGSAVNYYGGGAAVSFIRDFDWIVPGAVLGYQYTKDDSDVKWDSQHLFKLAGNVGFRLADNTVFNVFFGWTKDASGDLPAGTDDNYCDLGLEAGYSITEAFGLTAGWRKVLWLDNYESDLLYIGSSFLF
ncbi:MAG: hypothetical protein AB1921_11280 [Thermodesulfobacteriota bacterium]